MSMTIGNRLKGARLAAGYPVAADFARLVGETKQYLANIEKDAVTKPDPHKLLNIARALNVSLEWLISGEGLPARTSEMTPEESEIVSMLRSLSNDKREMILSMIRSVK